jgi:hypothetical protein
MVCGRRRKFASPRRPLFSSSDGFFLRVNRLPNHLSQLLMDTPETADDLHVVNLRLADGRFVQDVAIAHCSVIACVRAKPFVWFDGADVVGLEVTHRRWGLQHAITS